jgi:RNA polymerase sigma factor (sigma-70 family)
VTVQAPRPGFEHLLRELAPQVLGSVMRRYRDLAASEDAVQEALIAAAEQWPRDGIPNNPRGWLIHVALRRMTDHVRAEIARRNRESVLAEELPFVVAPEIYSEPQMDPEDTLVLLFMCCHPALTPASAIALTLRAVGGLTTGEIATAFLVPEATMAQRISRAKQSVKASRILFSLPEAQERAERLDSVMQVLYLIFNEGYTASTGDSLQRTDLSGEAVRLTRLLQSLLPREPEVVGLLGLMLLTDARREARTGPNGELVPLDEQDRSRWDRQLIREGTDLVTLAMAQGAVGEYQLQAAIAALHDEAADVESTDWAQILALYGVLMRMSDNPMVALNHAVAIAMVQSPAAGLALLEPLEKDERMRGTHRLDAVRGHLLERANDFEAATASYLAAAEKTSSLPERNYLMMRAARLRAQERNRRS